MRKLRYSKWTACLEVPSSAFLQKLGFGKSVVVWNRKFGKEVPFKPIMSKITPSSSTVDLMKWSCATNQVKISAHKQYFVWENVFILGDRFLRCFQLGFFQIIFSSQKSYWHPLLFICARNLSRNAIWNTYLGTLCIRNYFTKLLIWSFWIFFISA